MRFLLPIASTLLWLSLPVAAGNSIYQCRSDSGMSFQDSPCDAAEITEQQQSYKPPPISDSSRSYQDNIGRPATPKANKRRSAIRRATTSSPSANETLKQQQRCRKLENSINDIQSQMRSGYTVDEGRRLKRKLERERDDQKFYDCDD